PLELGEIPGQHHGTYRDGQWWWQARGYTPGGVELWNAIRALDYLETRPEVDAKRIGPTGRRPSCPSPASPTCTPTSARGSRRGWPRGSSPGTATACSW